MAQPPGKLVNQFKIEIAGVTGPGDALPGETNPQEFTPITEGVWGAIPGQRLAEYFESGTGDRVIHGQVESIQLPDITNNRRELLRYWAQYRARDGLEIMELTMSTTAVDPRLTALFNSKIRLEVYASLDNHRPGGAAVHSESMKVVAVGVVDSRPGPEWRYNQDNTMSITMEVREYAELIASAQAIAESPAPEYEEWFYVNVDDGILRCDNIDHWQQKRRTLGIG